MSLETILSNVEKTGKIQSDSIQEATKKEIAEKLLETKNDGKKIEKESKEIKKEIMRQLKKHYVSQFH